MKLAQILLLLSPSTHQTPMKIEESQVGIDLRLLTLNLPVPVISNWLKSVAGIERLVSLIALATGVDVHMCIYINSNTCYK